MRQDRDDGVELTVGKRQGVRIALNAVRTIADAPARGI